MSNAFRILALSGGGMRGVFTASVLVELQTALEQKYPRHGVRIVDYFDLIVGTSTGGLLGLGLALGKSPVDLLKAYKTTGRKIFPRWWLNPRMLPFGPQMWPLFSQRRLRDTVEAMIPNNKTLGDADLPLVLTAVRRASGEPTCLKTKHYGDFYRDHLMNAVEAGLATAAAPVAFAPVRTKGHGELLDGGLWANTPILVGIIEAQKYFQRDLRDVRVLSIGTTHSKMPPRCWWHGGGLREYGGLVGGRLQDLLWEGQRCLALHAAQLMLPEEALVVIDHEFAGSGYSLMDARKRTVLALEDAGKEQAQKCAAQVCRQFFTEPAQRLAIAAVATNHAVP